MTTILAQADFSGNQRLVDQAASRVCGEPAAGLQAHGFPGPSELSAAGSRPPSASILGALPYCGLTKSNNVPNDDDKLFRLGVISSHAQNPVSPIATTLFV